MAGKSFYDLDYIIEINEQRLEQYTVACEKVTERLTNIFVIYSAMAIFLVPIVRMIFLIKASYIQQLEECIDANISIYKRKATFYHNALIFVLMSAIPFLICLGYHISDQENAKEQKIVALKGKL